MSKCPKCGSNVAVFYHTEYILGYETNEEGIKEEDDFMCDVGVPLVSYAECENSDCGIRFPLIEVDGIVRVDTSKGRIFSEPKIIINSREHIVVLSQMVSAGHIELANDSRQERQIIIELAEKFEKIYNMNENIREDIRNNYIGYLGKFLDYYVEDGNFDNFIADYVDR